MPRRRRSGPKGPCPQRSVCSTARWWSGSTPASSSASARPEPTRARPARAISPPAWRAASSARRPSAARSRPRASRASGSWAPAGSAASTAASRSGPTSPPTWRSSRARRRSSSPPGSSRCSTSPRPRSCWRRWACRCSATAPTSCRSSTAPAAGRPSRRASTTPTQAARTAEAHWQLGGAALLLARDPDDGVEVEPLIEEALAAAATQGIHGQAVTPFVLSFLHERSDGRTLEVNRELIVANARLAAQVAVAASG